MTVFLQCYLRLTSDMNRLFYLRLIIFSKLVFGYSILLELISKVSFKTLNFSKKILKTNSCSKTRNSYLRKGMKADLPKNIQTTVAPQEVATNKVILFSHAYIPAKPRFMFMEIAFQARIFSSAWVRITKNSTSANQRVL